MRGETRGDRVASLAQPRMLLTMIGRFAPLAPGQEVYTSGVDQVYPAGVLIGHVVEAKTLELEKQAVIEPAVNLADLADVFIVAGMKGAQAQK
jgi:cell shape-determining protein MreC